MKIIFFYISLVILFSIPEVEGQYSYYDQTFFNSPVKHKIKITGSFAELRPDHFHMGIDIKSSKGVSGDPVYASAEGYISRIKIQSGGYGNSLYIDHPNGYTTVYAHLDQFDDSIADYVKAQQYEAKSFEIDIKPSPNQFQFDKGDEIGKLGNSGNSRGPHLHFEIRETDSEIPVNPFLFGIKPGDTKKPDLRRVRIYQLSSELRVKNKFDYALIYKNKDTKSIKGDTISIPAWRIGIGIEAFDYMDGTNNRNGLYNLKMSVDDNPTYAFTMEKVSFDETRYLNAHIDYKERKVNKKYYQKCFIQKGNKLSIYDYNKGSAIISLYENKAQKITIESTDIENNKAKVEFWVKRDPKITESSSEIFNYILKHDEPNVIKQNNLELHFPENSLYENLELYIGTNSSKNPNIKSDIYHIHNVNVPVHNSYKISLALPKVEKSLEEKLCIVAIDSKGYTSYGGLSDGKTLSAYVRQFGPFGIYIDDVAPTIKPSNFKKDMTGKKNMSFIIKDNIETSGKASGLRYNGWIDGEWILMEYDIKYKRLNHFFEKNLSSGKHIFRLEIIDDRNNKKEFISEFIK